MFTLKIIANIHSFKNKPSCISLSPESMPASGSSLSSPARMLSKAARGAQTGHEGAGGEAVLLKGEIAPCKHGQYSEAQIIEDIVPHFDTTW